MSELEKALSGEQYDSRDAEVISFQESVKLACWEFNHAAPNDPRRNEIISRLVSGYNPYVFIESDFKCVFGKNIHFKGMAMLNFNCTLLDSNIITIGDRTLIGPGCHIICTNHAIDAEERLKGLFNNRPITIGDRVWIGGNTTILPGVTIGDETVIGAGSVVTEDIPSGVVAVGNPCRVLRKITEQDKLINQMNNMEEN
jgi:maltose O-acetyltransferase